MGLYEEILMARRSTGAKESVPPSLTPHRSIELLRQRLSEFDRVNTLRRDDPDLKKWMSTTEAILDAAFGKPDGDSHEMTKKFKYAYGVTYMNMPDHHYEQEHHKRMLQKRAFLESCIEQLEILAPPAAQVAAGQYRFHLEIERVSGDLFRDGHYKQAALEAYIRVIEEVKRRSGLGLDGDSLMNQAFGCDNRIPAFKFNNLSTDAEKDEQKGFMFLFKGIVGLRNSKAHSNRLFNDPSRAHEYLALASLLMRVLELAA
jgi:uncharacterized protein (TIGR02391 family)